MREIVIVYQKTEIIKSKIKSVARKRFLEQEYDDVKMADIANELGIAKGTVFYHYKTKDELFYKVINEIVQTEFGGLVDSLKEMQPDRAILFLLNAMFAERKSKGLQSIMDNTSLLEKCHEMIDKSRREIISPILVELMNDGKSQGLFDIDDVEINSEILSLGFEGFIHNNYLKFDDKIFHKRFLKVATKICNDALRPTRIVFDFERNNEDGNY